MSFLNLTNLTPGTHTLDAYYAGDANHNKSNVFNLVFEIGAILEAEDVEMYYNGNETYDVTLTDLKGNPIVGETVNISINGQTYPFVTDEKGTVSLPIDFDSKNYTVITSYNGKYGNLNIINSIIVKPIIFGDDITLYFCNGTNYTLAILDSQGKPVIDKEVIFTISGNTYKAITDNNGVARLPITLNTGNYTITAINPITTEIIKNTIQIKPILIDNKDIISYYNDESVYTVKALDGQGNPAVNKIVTFTIGNIIYQALTNNEGIASFPINLLPGQYIITAEYNNYTVSNNITVKSTTNNNTIPQSNNIVMLPTGNPLLVLLFVLLTIPFVLRKK